MEQQICGYLLDMRSHILYNILNSARDYERGTTRPTQKLAFLMEGFVVYNAKTVTSQQPLR